MKNGTFKEMKEGKFSKQVLWFKIFEDEPSPPPPILSFFYWPHAVLILISFVSRTGAASTGASLRILIYVCKFLPPLEAHGYKSQV